VALASPGRVVPNGTASVPISRLRGGPGGEEGARFGPVRLERRNTVYRLEVRTQLQQQAMWVAAVLEDAEERELIPVDRDMWHESGYDSDGSWSESVLEASTSFVIRQPGEYYLRVYAEPEPGSTLARWLQEMPPAQPGSDLAAYEVSAPRVSVTLREGTMYSTYLGWYALLALAAGTGWVMAGNPSRVKVAWEKLKEAAADD
jgi:hypothetical protein